MHRTATTDVNASADRVFAVVADLSTYPEWLDLVQTAEPDGTAGDVGSEPAWTVTLRARIGPLARAKKLRMARVVHQQPSETGPGRVRFERRETDGRDHSSWVLESTVSDDPTAGTTVRMDLRYDGGLWTAPLEPVLGAVIERAGPRLDDYTNRP